MRIRLSAKQHQFLVGVVLKEYEVIINKLDYNGIVLKIEQNFLEIIFDMCTDMFDVIGYDINYNLTEEGKILEELIDIFLNKINNSN